MKNTSNTLDAPEAITQRAPLSTKIIYALGQLGWSLASFSVFNLFNYFYLPPETGEEVFPVYIYQGAILGFLTIHGLLTFGGRLIDAFTDIFIANYSDKTSSKMGKRKFFMAIGAVPFALFSFLVFYPISDTNLALNTGWILAVIVLFYICFTLYTVPYNALISELGHHPDDRMSISTIISVTWAMGFILGNSVYAVVAVFKETMPATEAFQLTLGIFTTIALACMLIPVFFLDENRYSKQTESKVSLGDSFVSAWKNKNFQSFILADLLYWVAITIIQMGMVYYITILLQLDEAYTSTLLTAAFFISFLYYWPVNLLSKKYGKKMVVSLAFLVFGATFLLLFFIGNLSMPIWLLIGGLSVLTAVPMAIFGIVPNAIVADIVHEHAEAEGIDQAGMFFAIRTFMMKVGISIASLIFPTFLLFGRGIGDDWGIRVSCLAALCFCILGFLLFQRYKDAK